MSVREIMTTPAVVAPPQTPIATAAKLMGDAGVGAVVVVEDHRVVGIVTDRDIVTRAVANHRPWDGRIDSVMSTPVVTLDVGQPVEEAYTTLRRLPFRRLPIVDRDHHAVVVGMLTVDDLILDISRRINDLAGPVTEEILDPRREPPVPAAVS